MRKNKGFTLIELLVVIAIIGVLAAVVLVSLNTARTKASDAAIKTNLASIKPEATMIFDENGDYTSDFCTNEKIAYAIDSAKASAGLADTVTTTDLNTAGTSTTAVCHLSDLNDAWAIDVPMKSLNTTSWCIDSNGVSKLLGNPLGASVGPPPPPPGYLAAGAVACEEEE